MLESNMFHLFSSAYSFLFASAFVMFLSYLPAEMSLEVPGVVSRLYSQATVGFSNSEFLLFSIFLDMRRLYSGMGEMAERLVSF